MKCQICKKEMDTGLIDDQNCGGDCLKCMAHAGDPDCIKALKKARSLKEQGKTKVGNS